MNDCRFLFNKTLYKSLTFKIENKKENEEREEPENEILDAENLADSKETYVVGNDHENMSDIVEDQDKSKDKKIETLVLQNLPDDTKLPEENLADSKETYVVGNDHGSLTDFLNEDENDIKVTNSGPEISTPAQQPKGFETFIAISPQFDKDAENVLTSTAVKSKGVRKPFPSRSSSVPKPKFNSTLTLKNPKPTGATRHLALVKPTTKPTNTVRPKNPFASKNIYYDERWIQKQENGFSKWLNYVLTPELDWKAGKLDMTKVWKACSKNPSLGAPTREALSAKAYRFDRELNRLRRRACTLWQTPAIAKVIAKVEIEIEMKRLVIRKDKTINRDLGLKRNFLELLFCYNPLWLRIGLETVFGEIIPMQGPCDMVGLSHFILDRILTNPDIMSHFAHPTVPHHYRPGFDETMKQFTLKKFLHLVYFLDQAKQHKLIKHNPCLFHKDSKIKSSSTILLNFSRDFLSGEGNVLKHLAHLEYKVSVKQTALEEFDFGVTNLAVDLKDGIRLW